MFRWLAKLPTRIAALGTVQLPERDWGPFAPKDPLKGCPTFKPLFDEGSVLSYELLYLDLEEACREAIRRVRSAVEASPHLDDELVALLSTPMGWKLEIVGLVGLLMVGTRAGPLEALWDAFDANSWVTPQLAAGASMIDPEFRAKARLRIERARYTPYTGPYLKTFEDAKRILREEGLDWKALQALFALLGRDPDERDWIEAQRSSARVREIFAFNSFQQDLGPWTLKWGDRLRTALAVT
jgi:hypothetical protein